MRTMRGVCILTVGFYVSLFKPNICYTASIEGGTNGTHEEEKKTLWNKGQLKRMQ